MTLISLICLLALSSSAVARSSYGSYSFQEPTQPRTLVPTLSPLPVQPTYGEKPTTFTGSYGSHVEEKSNFMGLRTLPSVVLPEVKPLTEAELQCRGKPAGTILLVDSGRRWITCLEEGAVEQACARSLYFSLESGRCERRPGQLENPCESSPCLNNGQCVAIDSSSFECRCAPGFDGTWCELDARVCQTQHPCGTAPGTRCQSFRSGAALQYTCIHNLGKAYGFSAQQVLSNPCIQDGTLALSVTNKGFVMCDGERMFIESCPGGTIWENMSKACVWPDMVDTIGSSRNIISTEDYSYSQPKVLPKTLPFPEPITTPMIPFEPTYTETTTFKPRMIEPVASYGHFVAPKARTFDVTPTLKESYGQHIVKPDFRVIPRSSSY